MRARRCYVYRCQFGDVVNQRQSIKNVLQFFLPNCDRRAQLGLKVNSSLIRIKNFNYKQECQHP